MRGQDGDHLARERLPVRRVVNSDGRAALQSQVFCVLRGLIHDGHPLLKRIGAWRGIYILIFKRSDSVFKVRGQSCPFISITTQKGQNRDIRQEKSKYFLRFSLWRRLTISLCPRFYYNQKMEKRRKTPKDVKTKLPSAKQCLFRVRGFNLSSYPNCLENWKRPDLRAKRQYFWKGYERRQVLRRHGVCSTAPFTP